jgi:hypothetical protein
MEVEELFVQNDDLCTWTGHIEHERNRMMVAMDRSKIETMLASIIVIDCG